MVTKNTLKLKVCSILYTYSMKDTFPRKYFNNYLSKSYKLYVLFVWIVIDWKRYRQKALRHITNSKYNAHTNPLFRQLKLFKIKKLSIIIDIVVCM